MQGGKHCVQASTEASTLNVLFEWLFGCLYWLVYIPLQCHIWDVMLVWTPVSRIPSRGRLRSADTTDYLVPRTRSKFGERAFCVSGPLVWNSLPESLRTVDSITTFRHRLKTHFFNIYLSGFYIHSFSFWPTVRSRPMPQEIRPSVCPSVTLVYCGQTA